MALLVLACSGVGKPVSTGDLTTPTSSASAAPTLIAIASEEPTAPALTAAPTIEPTTGPSPSPTQCPTGDVLTPIEYSRTPLRCFGSDDVTLLGWLDTPAPLGYEPPEIRPHWLWYPPEGTLYFMLYDHPTSEPDHVCDGCDGVVLHLAPSASVVLDGPARWVRATVHRRDPAAVRCHYVAPDFDYGPLPDDSIARAACRHSVVVTALEDAAAP